MKKILLFFMFLFLILPSQVNATQFNGYTNNTSMNSTDELILWDTPNGAVRNITFANFGVSLESPLELIIDLQDLQGSVTDSQVPNTITVDLSTTATTANNLAADGVNALTEIDQSIKTAANDTSKLVVGTAGATDECAKWDANGNLVTAGAACGSGGGGGGLNNVVEDTTPQLGGDLDMNGKGIDFPTTANITDVLDEDSMTSNSPTALATQQSIKAYVDNSVAAAGGGDITSVGNCTTSACFGGASGNTLTSTTSEIIDMSTASTFIYQRDDAGSVTFMGKDNSTPADTIYDTFGAGSVTVGSGDVTAVTITTDGTGTGELVVPNDSITLGTETVGNYAAGDSEAGAATTGDTATAFFSIGQIERARGGTGTDTSAYGVGLIGSDVSNNTVDVDTEAELETALAGADVVVVATDDITSANLATIVSNETGSGLVVFGTSPTIATPILTGKIDRNNVAVDDDDCTGEQGNAWYDTTDSAFEFCNVNSGTPSVLGGGASSPGGADTYVQYNDGGVLGGDAGMVYNETTNALTVDGTGTFDGLVVNGAGTDSLLSTNGIFDLGGTTQERIRLDFTGSNIVTATSTTGLTTANFSSIALQESGVGVLNSDEIDASSELAAIMDDETGTGLFVLSDDASVNLDGGNLEIPNSTTLPGTCTVGQIYADTDATTGQRIYLCETTNSWVLQGGAGGSGDVTDVGNCTGGACFTGASGTTLSSNTDIIIDLDEDNNGTETFQIRNGANTVTFEVSEIGYLSNFSGGHLETGEGFFFGDVPVYSDIHPNNNNLNVEGTLVPSSFIMPNASAPATNVTGEIALDTTITDHQPFLQYYDGAENMTVIAIDTAELPATDNEIIKYDAATDKFVLEADAGGGSGAFSDASDPVVLNTTTKDVAVGAALINAAKLSVDGDADQVQFAIQAHSTQNQNVIEVENSGGTIISSLDVLGGLTVNQINLGSDEAIQFPTATLTETGSDLQVSNADFEIIDDLNLILGTSEEWAIQYDEGVDDQLLIATTKTATQAITDPLIEILVGTTPTANQQVFGIAKGTQSSNTPLMTLDEDGDAEFAGVVTVVGTLVANEEMGVVLVEADTAVATGTIAIDLPVSDLKTGNVIDVTCFVHDKGVTGTTAVTLFRRRSGSNVEVLSTDVTIGDEWFVSDGVVNTSNDDLVLGDQLIFNVQSVHTTPPDGLSCVVKIDRTP